MIPTGPQIQPTWTPPVKRSPAPAVLYACMAAGTVLSGLLPLASQGDGKLFDAGPLFVMALLVPAALLLVAAVTCNNNSEMAGLGGGAAIGAASLLGAMAILLWKFSGGDGLGVGTYVITATAILGVIAFLVSLGVPTTGARSAMHWLSVAAGFVMCLGCTLVPSEASGYGVTWADFNGFGEGSDAVLGIAFQMILWVPLLALIVCVVKGGRFGALFGLGGSLVLVWLIFAAKADIKPESGYNGFSAVPSQLHPAAVVGAVAVVITVLIALATSTVSELSPVAGGPGLVAAPQGRWSPDPFARYESRFWNGVEWTEHVATGGVPAVDPPTWPNSIPAPPVVPTPPPPPAPLMQTTVVAAAPLVVGQLLNPVVDPDATVPRDPVAGAVPTAELVLDTGQRVVLVGALVIGRAPRPQAKEPSATLLPIEDSTMSVSATHILVGPALGGVWVEDTGSTNGSSVVGPHGATVELRAGVRDVAANGSTIHFGDRSARVVASETN